MKPLLYGLVCYILVTAGAFADSYTNTLFYGVNLIANQLDHGSNTFTELFSNSDGSWDGDVIPARSMHQLRHLLFRLR